MKLISLIKKTTNLSSTFSFWVSHLLHQQLQVKLLHTKASLFLTRAIVADDYIGKLAPFYGKIMECDKPKCAGTNVHWGLIHHPALSVITVILLSCLTSLDWFQLGPLGKRIIKNDRPHT